jgi:hypothetical protein
MFEHLFELLLHAKSGVFAAVFLVGTTGALVSATVQNGAATITFTEASPSPSGSASPTASPSPSASPSPTASHTASPTASPTGSPSASPSSSSSSSPDSSRSNCKAKSGAGVDATQTVNRAFAQFHTDLMHLRESAKVDAARKTLADADKQLKQIRENAVKAIHASTSCFKRDDDDKIDNDKDEDKDEDANEATVTPTASPSPSPSPSASPSPTPSASPTATATAGTTSTDPKTIADNAVAAMKLVFDTANAGLPATTATPRPSHSPESHDSNKHKGGHDQKDDD